MEEEKIKAKTFFEEKKLEFLRKGDIEKVKFLESLNKKLIPSQIKRIQQNDKTVLNELVLPKWLSWDLLFDWANNVKLSNGLKRCIFCDKVDAVFIDFKEKFVCHDCFMKLKEL